MAVEEHWAFVYGVLQAGDLLAEEHEIFVGPSYESLCTPTDTAVMLAAFDHGLTPADATRIHDRVVGPLTALFEADPTLRAATGRAGYFQLLAAAARLAARGEPGEPLIARLADESLRRLDGPAPFSTEEADELVARWYANLRG